MQAPPQKIQMTYTYAIFTMCIYQRLHRWKFKIDQNANVLCTTFYCTQHPDFWTLFNKIPGGYMWCTATVYSYPFAVPTWRRLLSLFVRTNTWPPFFPNREFLQRKTTPFHSTLYRFFFRRTHIHTPHVCLWTIPYESSTEVLQNSYCIPIATSPANWMKIISTVIFIAAKRHPGLFENTSVYTGSSTSSRL